MIQKGEQSGLQLSGETTGCQISTPGSVVNILYLDRKVCCQIMFHFQSCIKHSKEKTSWRFAQIWETGWKRKRDEDSNRWAATDGLLALCQESNGTQYCEPHTGVHCSTDLMMAGIKEGGNEMCCFGVGEEITTWMMPVLRYIDYSLGKCCNWLISAWLNNHLDHHWFNLDDHWIHLDDCCFSLTSNHRVACMSYNWCNTRNIKIKPGM